MKIGGVSEQIGERCPTGVHPAVLVGVYDVGTHEGYQGKIQPKVCLWWEAGVRDSKGRPFTLPDVVTNSSHEKSTMAQRFSCLVGRALTEPEQKDGLDTDMMIGKSCLVLVSPPKKAGGWPFIENVMPLPTGMPVPKKMGDYAQEPRFVTILKAKALSAAQVAERRKALEVLGTAPSGGDADFDEKIPF